MERILLRDGLVYDGSGCEGVRSDILIDGDTVVRVAARIAPDPPEAVVVDCAGCAVSPGFIDIHGHSDFAILACPLAESRVAAGVTTELAGNCGSSPFPVGGELSRRRNVQLRGIWSVLADGTRGIDWADASGYEERVSASGISLNLAFLIGHGNLRALTVGYGDAPATADQIDRMSGLLADGIDAGAYGLSTGLIYPPGCHASTDEIAALARGVGRAGGLYASHMRNEGSRLLEALDEFVAIVEAGQCRGIVSHLKTMGPANWDKLDAAIARIEAARDRGLYVVADRYPYLASMTGLDSILFPRWVVEGTLEDEVARLADPAMRDRLRDAVDELHPDGGWPDRIRLCGCATEANAALAGLSLRELAERRGTDPLTAAIDLLIEEKTTVSAVQFAMSDDNLRRILRLPYVMCASDSSVRTLSRTGRAKPHPRGFGTPARFLAHYVRDAGLMTWGEGIRRLTGLPAEVLGWRRRGRLAEGALADITIFDPEALADRATYAEPVAAPAGICHVMVAGQFVIHDGQHTGAKPGRIIKRGEPE